MKACEKMSAGSMSRPALAMVFLSMLAAANERHVLVPRVVIVTAFPPELTRYESETFRVGGAVRE